MGEPASTLLPSPHSPVPERVTGTWLALVPRGSLPRGNVAQWTERERHVLEELCGRGRPSLRPGRSLSRCRWPRRLSASVCCTCTASSACHPVLNGVRVWLVLPGSSAWQDQLRWRTQDLFAVLLGWRQLGDRPFASIQAAHKLTGCLNSMILLPSWPGRWPGPPGCGWR